jgi:hypothetical protein
MENLENISALENKIAIIDLEPSVKGNKLIIDCDGWVPIKEVTALRPYPKTYPSLKN